VTSKTYCPKSGMGLPDRPSPVTYPRTAADPRSPSPWAGRPKSLRGWRPRSGTQDAEGAARVRSLLKARSMGADGRHEHHP
jgi:hypothetical protein